MQIRVSSLVISRAEQLNTEGVATVGKQVISELCILYLTKRREM